MGWHPEAWFQVEILTLNFSLYLLANPSGCVSILAINGFLFPPQSLGLGGPLLSAQQPPPDRWLILPWPVLSPQGY